MDVLRLTAAGLCLLLSSTAVDAAQRPINTRATVCEDCSYQQAVSYAKAHAAPRIECSYATEIRDLASEQCHSTESRYIVYSAASQQSYGFRLYHSNQGGSADALTLQLADEPVEAEVTRLLQLAADARGHLQQGIAQIPADIIKQTGLYAVRSPAEFSTYADSNNTCSQDPHARALQDALSSNRRLNTLQLAAGNSLLSKKAETVTWFKSKAGLTLFNLDTVSFSISSPSSKFGSVTVSGTFNVNAESDTQFITRTYYPNAEHDAVNAGLTPTSTTFSKVVDRIDYASGAPVASVDTNATFIEGIGLRFLIEAKTDKPFAAGKCVAEKHQALLGEL